MKRFLGIVCLLYSGLIIYVVVTDTLKNFLAPNMQMYLKIAVVPLVIMGIVLCISKSTHYHFRFSDLVLLLPLVMIIFASNGKFTISLASNRTSNLNAKEIKVVEEPVIDVEDDDKKQEIFTADFEVIDENYNELANYITYPPKPENLIGKKIHVSGLSLKKASYLPEQYAMIGKYSISCCAADAEFIGFILDYDKNKIDNNTWYDVEGILELGEDSSGYQIMLVKVINIKELDESKQEQYIYPCNNYGDGKCSEVLKYNLEY